MYCKARELVSGRIYFIDLLRQFAHPAALGFEDSADLLSNLEQVSIAEPRCHKRQSYRHAVLSLEARNINNRSVKRLIFRQQTQACYYLLG